MEKLCEENYFSKENEKYYTGHSQILSFMDCPARTMAEINGEWEKETTTALLVGSYIDAAISNTLDIFKAQHPEILKKDGTLKSDYIQADYILERIQRDKMFMKYISGNHQTIMTAVYNRFTHKWYTEKEALQLTQVDGNLIPVKIKIDSYFPDKAIVDLKTTKDFNPIWNEKLKVKQNFADYWGYPLQGALYQKVVEVNTGKKLPFFIAAVTKEKEPDLALLSIEQETLDEQMENLENWGTFDMISEFKNGISIPVRCEHCDYCKYTKEITEILNYKFINGKEE